MRYIVGFLLGSCSLCSLGSAQTLSQQASTGFFSQPAQLGRVSHQENSATFTTNDPRPMGRAVVTLRREYGWLIDYEDPIYATAELVSPRSATGEGIATSKKSIMIPAGGSFNASYPENLASTMDSDQQREDAFTALLKAYSLSGNPGHFRLSSTEPDRLAVEGFSDTNPPLLDTKISLALNGIPAYNAIEQALRILQLKVGHRLALGMVPARPLSACVVNHSFENIAAREVVLEIINECDLQLVYEFLYDVNIDFYYLNLDFAVKVAYGAQGQQLLTPAPPQKK